MHLVPAQLEQAFYQSLGQLLCTSYHALTGNDLTNNLANGQSDIINLFNAQRVIVAHDTQADPIFNFGNRAALQLFALSWPEFTTLPSRKSAEPLERNERIKLLDQVTKNGYISDYSGVRTASNGDRFLIEQALVWNLTDKNGRFCGQAATFTQWKSIPHSSSSYEEPAK